MVERLLELDKSLFLFLNSLGSDRFDLLWLIITRQSAWIPIFLIILYLVFKHLGWKHALLVIGCISLLLLFTDQATNLVKGYFQRLRPVNNPDFAEVMRIVQIRNSFSFFSGHASNSMGVAILLYLIMKPYLKYMGFIFLWPLIFAYSRIYLGLHYPFDILCGYLFGVLTGILFYQLYKFARNKFFPKQKENLDHPTNG